MTAAPEVKAAVHDYRARGFWCVPIDSGSKGITRDEWQNLRIVDAEVDNYWNPETIVEIRSTGAQTVVAPSTHPSGDRYTWHSRNNPAEVDGAELADFVARVASCALLAKKWPSAGTRHDAANALAGLLVKRWPVQDVEQFMRALMDAVGHHRADYIGAVKDAKAKLNQGRNVTGGPRLAELEGRSMSAQVRQFIRECVARRQIGDSR